MHLRRLLILPVFAACLYAAGAGRADEEKKEDKKEDKKVTVDGKAVDTYVYRSLASFINVGADLYNSGNYLGCYTHYDNALAALKPLLAHRPKLQKAIDDAVAKAKTAPVPDRAFILREVIDQVRKDTSPNPTPITPVTKTLWDRLGGEVGVGKVVDDFVATAAKDPKVDFDRGGKYKPDVPMLKKRLVELVSAVSGGPLKYTGKSMKDVHKGMWITNEEFDATKKQDEDAKAVLDVIEGTRRDIVEGKKPEPEPTAKTLWDKLGGEKAVAKVVDDFFATAAKDPKVNFDRGGTFKLDEEGAIKAKKKMVAWISSQAGGPLKYDGKSMKEAHKGLGITSEEFDATGKHLADALKKNGVKDDDAKALLDVFVKFKSDVVEPKKPDPEPSAKTLWDRLGGQAGVAKLVDEVVNAAIADPKVNFYRDPNYKPSKEQVAKLKEHSVEWVSAQTGGPLPYKGKALKAAHASMKITDPEFDAAVRLLQTALKIHNVPEDDAKVLLEKVNATRKDVVEK